MAESTYAATLKGSTESASPADGVNMSFAPPLKKIDHLSQMLFEMPNPLFIHALMFLKPKQIEEEATRGVSATQHGVTAENNNTNEAQYKRIERQVQDWFLQKVVKNHIEFRSSLLEKRYKSFWQERIKFNPETCHNDFHHYFQTVHLYPKSHLDKKEAENDSASIPRSEEELYEEYEQVLLENVGNLVSEENAIFLASQEAAEKNKQRDNTRANMLLWKVFILFYHDEENSILRTSIVLRFHHCIGDGLALLELLLSTSDEVNDIQPKWPFEILGHSIKQRHFFIGKQQEPSRSGFMHEQLMSLKQKAASCLQFIKKVLMTMATYLFIIFGCIASLLKYCSYVFVEHDEPFFHEHFHLPKKEKEQSRQRIDYGLCLSPRIPMQALKQAAKKHNTSLNGVLLYCVQQAIAKYIQSRIQRTANGSAEENQKRFERKFRKFMFRFSISMNMRMPKAVPQDELWLAKLKNASTGAFIHLPMAFQKPSETIASSESAFSETHVSLLSEIHGVLCRLKNGCDALATHALTRMLVIFPKCIRSRLFSFYMNQIRILYSNVPGPTQKISIGNGLKIEDLVFFMPNPKNIFCSISYNGNLRLCFLSDKHRLDQKEWMKHFADTVNSIAEQNSPCTSSTA